MKIKRKWVAPLFALAFSSNLLAVGEEMQASILCKDQKLKEKDCLKEACTQAEVKVILECDKRGLGSYKVLKARSKYVWWEPNYKHRAVCELVFVCRKL